MQAPNTKQTMRLKEQARVHLREGFALTQISYVFRVRDSFEEIFLPLPTIGRAVIKK